MNFRIIVSLWVFHLKLIKMRTYSFVVYNNYGNNCVTLSIIAPAIRTLEKFMSSVITWSTRRKTTKPHRRLNLEKGALVLCAYTHEKDLRCLLGSFKINNFINWNSNTKKEQRAVLIYSMQKVYHRTGKPLLSLACLIYTM